MSPGRILLAAAIGGLLALEREAFLQAQLARPIVLCPLLGWILGDPSAGLAVGAPLELLFIGSARLGAVAAPNETAISAGVVSATLASGLEGAGVATTACLSFLLLAPVAWGWRGIDAWKERRAGADAGRADLLVKKGDIEAGLRLHFRSLWIPFLSTSAFVVLCCALVGPLVGAIRFHLPPAVVWAAAVGWAGILMAGGGMGMALGGRVGRGIWALLCLALLLLPWEVGG